jgi:hypothetical protein
MKTTQFKRTPDGVKTSRMLEVQKRIGATLEDDYKAKYLDGGWGQKRLADHWGVRRGQIFGQLCKGRRSWVQMLKLPAREAPVPTRIPAPLQTNVKHVALMIRC